MSFFKSIPKLLVVIFLDFLRAFDRIDSDFIFSPYRILVIKTNSFT